MTINKEILRLAIPNILSNISVPLISSVDTGLMGFTSTAHLAAIGSASMIFNFLYWNFGFLRMGTTGMVAQAHGAEDRFEKCRVLYQSSLVAILLASLLLIFYPIIQQFSFNLMNLSNENKILAAEYFSMRIWDAPATLLLYVLMAWFFGNQNAYIPFIITLIINIVNIGLSIYFVKSLNMGITGVALGSVIGNYAGVLFGVIILLKKYTLIRIPWSKITSNLTRFVSVNRDIFIRTLLLSFTFAFLYSQAAIYGVVFLGVNVVLLQFLNWMSYGVDGFAYASESLVGKYKGAKNNALVKLSIKLTMVWGFVVAALFALTYLIFFDGLAGLFTNEEVVLAELRHYKYWIASIPLVAFASYIWDGIFIGLTASKAMRNTMVVSFIFYLASYFLLKNALGFNALIVALSTYLIVRGIAQTYLYKKYGVELT